MQRCALADEFVHHPYVGADAHEQDRVSLDGAIPCLLEVGGEPVVGLGEVGELVDHEYCGSLSRGSHAGGAQRGEPAREGHSGECFGREQRRFDHRVGELAQRLFARTPGSLEIAVTSTARPAELLHEPRLADTTPAANPDEPAVPRVPHGRQLVGEDL